MKTSISILLLLPTLVFAEPSLPLKMAHGKNFFGCDEAINKAFEFARGDVRVGVSGFSELKDDSIRLMPLQGHQVTAFILKLIFANKG
jgi:hypothetical protein